MSIFTTAVLLFVSIIHLTPALGVLGADRLQQLYGIAISDTDLLILMRHRAVLFGLLGLFFVVSAFKPDIQGLAITVALLSMISFVLLAMFSGPYNGQIGRAVLVDLVAIGLLMLVVAGRRLVT